VRAIRVWNPHTLSLATLVVVVLILAVLQYRWIDQIAVAQETRAESRLREDLGLIVDAFDTEITRAVLVFTFALSPGEAVKEALDQTWTTWNRESPWPRVVSGLTYLEAADEGRWRTRSWGAAYAFDPRSMLRAGGLTDPPLGELRTGEVVSVRAQSRLLFVERQPCMLWPLPTLSDPPGPLRLNWILICFDLTYLTDTFFSQLLEKHAAPEERRDFQLQIEPRGSAAPGTMIVVDQFHYRPDCVTGAAPKEAELIVGGPNERPGHSPSMVRGFSGRFEIRSGAPLAALLHTEGMCQAGPPPDSGLLEIAVRRRPGTLIDLFTGFRQRNFFVSGLVMVVLLAALAALVLSTERARQLARLQTVVAAGISHELRTPLASLSVAADHLKHGYVENVEQARRYGEIIDAQSKRLGHVVDQALALAGLGQPKGASFAHAASVAQVIDAACDALASQAKEAGMEIERHTASDIPSVSADPNLLLRCLTNLIENSIKYARSGGWVQVSARRTQYAGRSVVEVTVEDRGPGIDDDETAAVFEPFYRGASARHSRQPGSGLGLSIVMSAVQACGGSISLERAVPQGCRFRLCLRTLDDGDVIHTAGSEA